MSEPELKLPDPETREEIRCLGLTLAEQMADLTLMNQTILKRVEEIQGATVQTQINQARAALDHEKMLASVDELLGTVKHSVQGLSLQVQHLRAILKKDDPSE